MSDTPIKKGCCTRPGIVRPTNAPRPIFRPTNAPRPAIQRPIKSPIAKPMR